MGGYPLDMRIVRMATLGLVLLALVGSYLLERHAVRSFSDEDVRELRAAAFLEGLTVDAYLRRNDALFDVYTINPEGVQERDCHT